RQRRLSRRPELEVPLTSPLRASLDGRADNHVAVDGAGNRAGNQQQVALGIHADDLEILNGDLLVTEVARHLLALEHTARGLVLTDRARHAVRPRVAVGHVLGAEVVALDRTGKALALTDTDDVDLLT